ncbi:hypothetical protein B0920_11185 [Massilia sp. KIM]|uniref:DUF2059 domain-containing protein n=1 Tax=Massilia sp. KIM TaxID=1955422 RepID=UPI00099009A5|nr:DUF2059 domain-containing protein [Massilia sp. KIM]OON63877.1 hypothetical protein B0920_11185 [Massilia sp. KIM]
MKKFFVALATAATLAGLPSFAVAAPDAQTTAAVKAMLDAMEIKKVMAASFVQMEQQIPVMMRAQVMAAIEADTSLSPEKRKEAIARVDQMVPRAAEAVGRLFRDPSLLDEMVNEMVPLYANHFTTAEIKELTAFYRSPLGRKMLANMPKLSAESMALGQRVVAPRLNGMMQDVMKSLQNP